MCKVRAYDITTDLPVQCRDSLYEIDEHGRKALYESGAHQNVNVGFQEALAEATYLSSGHGDLPYRKCELSQTEDDAFPSYSSTRGMVSNYISWKRFLYANPFVSDAPHTAKLKAIFSKN